MTAEDNTVNKYIITRMLNKLKHTVTVVENGKMAVEEFERNGKDYDLILMDVQMPEMDGIEATKKVSTKLLPFPNQFTKHLYWLFDHIKKSKVN